MPKASLHVIFWKDLARQFWFSASQTCLGTNVPLAWYSWGLVCGEGGAPSTIPLHNLRVTSHVLHQDVPLGRYQVRFF